MSTTFDVTLAASDGSSTTIQIVHSWVPLPFSDKWTGDAAALGSAGGTVANWGTTNAILHTGMGAASNITLDSFSKNTEQGQTGTGSKLTLDGAFPDGDLTWTCDKVS
jgi:hypothetical protein